MVAFNWDKFLNQKEGSISHLDWEVASLMAGDWKTCYCGVNLQHINKNSAFEPLDKEIYDIGEKFNDAIKAKNLSSARYFAFRLRNKK